MNRINIIDKMLNDYRELNKKHNTLCAPSDAYNEAIKNSFGTFDAFKKALQNGDEVASKILMEELKRSLEKREDDEVLVKWGKSRKAIQKLFLSSEIMDEPYDAENKKLLKLIREDKDPCKQELVIFDVDEDYFDGDYIVKINEEYDLENFLLRKIEAGRVILGKQPPQTFLKLFEKIKECYMFGLYEATIIFCRALLEEVLEDHIKKRDKVAYIHCEKDKGFIEMLIDNSSLLEILKEEAHEKIRRPANDILHKPKKIKEFPVKKVSVMFPVVGKVSVFAKMDSELKQEALSSIRLIILVIEYLYNYDRS